MAEQSVEVITTITLRDNPTINRTHRGRLEVCSDDRGAYVSFWVESPSAADELAEALKGVAAEMRKEPSDA